MKNPLKILVVLLFLFSASISWQCAGSARPQPDENLLQVESRNILIDSSFASFPEMETFLVPYRNDLNREMTVVIGTAAMSLTKGKPEAPLNNFVADLMLKRANQEFDRPVQASFTNLGGLRVEIPKGLITRGKIFEVMPFENELVVLEMSGVQLVGLAREIGAVGGEAIGGMRVEYQDTVLTQMLVQGQTVTHDSLYYLVTTDYLASPGRSRFKVLGLAPRHFLGVTLRDAILDEIRERQAKGQPVSAERDQRIIVRPSTRN